MACIPTIGNIYFIYWARFIIIRPELSNRARLNGIFLACLG